MGPNITLYTSIVIKIADILKKKIPGQNSGQSQKHEISSIYISMCP